ncbi:hypothetical protein IFM89_030906 [Coptis chinensis]|uniref:Aminotransferase class I/classII large domain-containing protein n=1 Tax=Coptis chinensis TaxID=261450 RepID=A0A835I619_9MAGN|nr:hypothetical protein IFM89_030906 [Coptis chinensis]
MSKGLDHETLNENVKKAQYAVRGELYLRASELQKEGKKIIFTNVGNLHALGQKPLTFPRQVMVYAKLHFYWMILIDGILVPVPQYTLYLAAISLYGGSLVPYYLEETENWGLDVNNLPGRFAKARSRGITVRAMVIIIPGNPTEHIPGCTTLLKCEKGLPISKELQLVSFHTVSKGYCGECGQRGGPPKPGDISYQKDVQESNSVLESLRRRAHIMINGFNSCRNVVCNFTKGAMYSFPQIRLPPKAIEVAKKAGKVPDVFYCLKLLEATGISTVPSSGFGQK